MRVRTGYSFRAASGTLKEVFHHLSDLEWGFYPITDRASTFGYNPWRKICEDAGVKPVFGVELLVSPNPTAKKPVADAWVFIAKDSLTPIHELVKIATAQFRYNPLLTYEQALSSDTIKIMGHKTPIHEMPDNWDTTDELFFGLTPSLTKGQYNRYKDHNIRPVAMSDNRFLRPEGKQLYEIITGRDSEIQTYPQWLMSDGTWRDYVGNKLRLGADVLDEAIANRQLIGDRSNANMVSGHLPVVDWPKTIEQQCYEAAEELGVDLTDPVYKERLQKELDLIHEKQFDDYFQIVGDLVRYAKEVMVVGPARGSSCGSLVCYLLKITTVDPIPHGLVFERFIDINRNDLPDIDIDFSDEKRWEAFDYLEGKYGEDHMARLGTVSTYKPRMAINEAGAGLKIPKWETEAAMDGLIERSSGDARALDTLEDTLRETPKGKALLNKHPEILIATQMEGHPRHSGQHAAGIILTEKPILEHVAIDSRKNSAQCDKHDAEDLDLLKIDALGLTQLSVFEHTMDLIGMEYSKLYDLPLDDHAAFEVLNKGHYAGIFQFAGRALQTLTEQVTVDVFDDLASISALARPGPLVSGGAQEWVDRKNGAHAITYPHEMFRPYIEDTFGVIVYQEQIMSIGREVGKMGWKEVTALRKAMSKSLGKEYFDQFGEQFKKGAVENGVPLEVAAEVWEGMCFTGDTQIRLCDNSNRPSVMTIEEIYDLYVENPGPWIKKHKSMPKLISWFGEDAIPQTVLKITKMGEKECFEYEFDDGTCVRCTDDHKFIINGEWSEIGSALVGDTFFGLKKMKPPSQRPNGRGKGHNTNNGGGEFKSGKDHPAFINGRSKEKAKFRERMMGEPCEGCGEYKANMEAHHLDFNGGRDDPFSMKWLCKNCHVAEHKYIGLKRAEWEPDSGRKLIGIKPLGNKMTYDFSMPDVHNFMLANGLIAHNCDYGSWAFNKSHSVAYGLISYYCCWLKAHYPLEFAAGTLSHESDPEKQLKLLRELAEEGIRYVPVDPEFSTDKWTVGEKDGVKYLVGPLSSVNGIGPKLVTQIMDARKKGDPLPKRAQVLLGTSTTKIDSLYPVEERIKAICPDLRDRNIMTEPTKIGDITEEHQRDLYGVVIIGRAIKINPRNENETIKVAKRGFVRPDTEPLESLNLTMEDDTGQIFAHISRFDYERIGKEIVDRGRPDKSIYVLKGKLIKQRRFMIVERVMYFGDMDPNYSEEEKVAAE